MNTFFSQFHFMRPWWLLGVLPLLLFLFWVWRVRARQTVWNDICDAALMPYVMVQETVVTQGRQGMWYAMLMGVLTCLALAGPTWSKTDLPVYQSPKTRIIVLDLSPTMLTQDLKPSRLERAKYKLVDILKESEGMSLGLVVFASSAHAVSPVTTDIQTLMHHIPVLSPSIMPVKGDNPVLGVQLAQRLLERAEAIMSDAEVILMTDSPGLGGLDTALSHLVSQGVHVGILGVGTEEGGPIPAPQGGFMMDSSGQVSVAHLDISSLKALASQVGASYATLQPDHQDLDAILKSDLNVDLKAQHQQAEYWEDQGHWLIWCVMALIAFSFRRGLLGIPLLALLLMGFVFHDPMGEGVAYYRAGQYEQALKSFEQVPTADGDYNRGNTLAHLQRYDEAIVSYQHALKKDPYMQDAEANIALVEEIKKQQQDQKKGSSEDQDKKENQEQQKQDPQEQDKPAAPEQSPPEEKKDNQQDKTPEPPPPEEQSQDQSEPPESDAEEEKESSEEEALSPPPSENEINRLLNQVPDDPGGLLRRQFELQAQQGRAS